MEELIDLPDTPRPGTRIASILCGATLIVAIGTGIIDTVWPAPKRALVGQEQVAAAAARKSRNPWDGSAARWLEKELELRSRVRRTVGPYLAAVMFKYAHVVGTDAIRGADDWLFLRSRALLSATNRESALVMVPRVFGLVHRTLLCRGVDLVVMPLPRKAVVCQETFPKQIDVDPGFDRGIIDGLRNAGIPTVDVLDEYLAAPDADCYLQIDTHWALPAQLMLARAAAEIRPALARPEGPMPLPTESVPTRTALLGFAGIDREHPAADTIEAAPRVRVARKTLYRPRTGLLGEAVPVFGETEVALLGSSFTKTYDLGVALDAALSVPVAKYGLRGGEMLEAIDEVYSSDEFSEHPTTVFYEFPLNQASDLMRKGGGGWKAACRLFLHLQPARVEVVEGAAPPKLHSGAPSRAIWARGSLMSSGDGVTGVRVTVADGAAPTRWRLHVGDRFIPFDLPAGPASVVVPIVHAEALGADVRLIARNPAAKSVDLKVDVVASIGLGAMEPIPQSSSSRRIYEPVDVQTLPEGAAIVLRGLQRGGAFSITARGTTSGEAEVVRVWEFERMGPGTAILDMQAFHGAELNSVELSRPVQGVTVSVAAPLIGG